MSRELVYRISLSTSDAKRQASNIRSTFEQELKRITLGKLDTSSLRAGANDARQLRAEIDRVSSSAQQAANQLNNIQVPNIGNAISQAIGSVGLPPALLGGGLALGGIAIALAGPISEMARLGTESIRTEKAFEILSGGASQAQKNIEAIQQASGGTVSAFQAAQYGTQALSLGLATTAAEFGRLTQAARAVAFVSPVINDIGSAISELGLASANLSYRRLDQLGLSVTEVRSKMSELRRENESMSESAAFLEAAVSTLLSKYGPILESEEARATGLERISAAIQDIKTQAAQDITVTVNVITNPVAGFLEDYTKGEKEIQRFLDNKDEAYRIVDQGVKGTDAASQSYIDSINETIRLWEAGELSAEDYRIRLDGLVTGLHEYTTAQEQATAATQKAENDRIASIFEQQPAIGQALASRAAKAGQGGNIEESIRIYREQKAQVEGLLEELAATGISDAGEIAIRTAVIVDQLLAPFDELEARASEFDLMSALGNFTDVGTALSGLNAGFVDFLPGLSAAREELITLSNEMALTGQLSDEQAERLEYLSAVAYSVADGGSALNAVVAELGGSFLESNAYAAELVNQLFMAEAAYAQGAITGDIYAGIMATLTGQLLTVAQGAGIATGAIMQLNAAQSGMASIGGLAIGGSIANRIQTQQQAAGREQNRREQERYNRDLERSQERSASRAGKLLEDGAKKANQELKSALDKVPGLFSTTQVTEQDMKDAEMGVYQEKADEYLRRLRDEVQNGRDWEDVSIEEARAGLERAGLEVGATAEQTLTFLERAINDSSLFSAAENIPIFINEEAVKQAQELQKKSEEGRKNIYAYFGVQVDEAVTAATGGGGGAAVEVKPPEFVDIDPLTEGLQTGLDEYVATTGAVIKEQVATAKALFFDPATLFGATGGKAGAMGPAAKPEITVTADPAATALMPVITGQVQPTVNVQFAGAQAGAQAATAPGTMTITPTLDLTGIQAQLDALTAPTLDVKLSLNAENIISINGLIGALTPTISPLLNASTEAMSTFAATLEANMPTVGVETNLTASVGTMSEFTVYLQDNIPTPGIEVNLTTTVGAMSDFTVYLQDNVPTPGIQTALAVTIEEIQLFEKLVSGLVHPTVTVDLATQQQQTNEDGSQGANAITPLITGINTQIRGSQEEIKNQGITIAMILMAGIAAHLQGGQTTGGEQASTPLADALMTNVSTQFSAAQGMFYAVGFLPAQSVESGFKGYGYTGLSSGLLDALTTGIRADADSYMQRGATIAGYVQAGMNQQFSAETGVRSAIAAGAAWGNAFMQGVFEALNGAGFVDQISTQVIDGITGELEQP